MRYVSTFSGIEAASVAWEPLGWQPIAFSENDPFPSAVLKYRYPSIPNLGDITRIDWNEIARIHDTDLLVGGSPCQSFSIAGSRTGLSGSSGLMWEYVRAVKELRPRWILWENVPGALSSTHGEDFRCLLQALDYIGYALAWRVLDAEFFGLAQRRRRLFLVGSLDPDHDPADALFSHVDLGDSMKPYLPNNDGISKATGHSTDTGVRVLDFSQNASRFRYAKTGVCQTLTSHAGTGGNNVPMILSGRPSVIRKLTPIECERLQGFPDGWTDVPYHNRTHAIDSARYKALGNSMAVPVMTWIGRAIEETDNGMKGAADAFDQLQTSSGTVDKPPIHGHWMRAGICKNGNYRMAIIPEWTNTPTTRPLWDILEDPSMIPTKYRFSARASRGVLTRAKNKGDTMEPSLEAVLRRQIQD